MGDHPNTLQLRRPILCKLKVCFTLYLLMLVGGLLSTVFVIWTTGTTSFSKHVGGLRLGLVLFVGILCILSAAHQVFIYLSIHRLDEHPESYYERFPEWICSPWDFVLRILVFLCLLFAAGKFLSCSGFGGAAFTSVLAACFLFNLAWDTCAARYNTTRLSIKNMKYPESLEVYFLCDGIALLLWTSMLLAIVLIEIDGIFVNLLLVVFLFLLAYSGAIGWRAIRAYILLRNGESLRPSFSDTQ